MLVIIFILVSAIPFFQWIIAKKNTEDKVEYSFPKELFDCDLKELKCEQTLHSGVSRISLQNRGSVRIAQGHILSLNDIEEKKAVVYSVELP